MDADTCRDIGIFTAIARVKDIVTDTDTFIATATDFDCEIFSISLIDADTFVDVKCRRRIFITYAIVSDIEIA